jgi:hypothetical protein
MIRKWIEKKIEARVNEYLATLEVNEEKIAEHVEVDPELVAGHIEPEDLAVHIDMEDAVRDALDYDDIADNVHLGELADHIDKYDLAYNLDMRDIADNLDSSDIASYIEADSQDVAEHIELSELAYCLADEDGLINALAGNTDFVLKLGEEIQDKVVDAITDTMNHMVNENAKKINAVIEALTLLEDAFSGAVTQLRWALETKEENE